MNRRDTHQAKWQAGKIATSARGLHIAALAIVAAVFSAAGVSTALGMAAGSGPSVRMMVKQIKLDGAQDVAAARRAWANQYGQDVSQMPNLPDVAVATPDQRAAAVDLLTRSKAATAAYVDPANAEAAGYENFQVELTVAEQEQPTLASRMQQIDAGIKPVGGAMIHVHDGHRNNTVLDPSSPPALLYEYLGHDTWRLIGVMYFANGAFPSPPPDPGGPITRWHYHDEAPGSLMMHVYFVSGSDVSDSELAQAYRKM